MSDSRPFAHLHCHTTYSTLDGATRLKDLIKKVKDSGMNAVATTDHGNMYGSFEFYNACRGADINPIVGLEAYIAPGSRFDRTGASRQKEAACHLTLLAQNRTGFYNLIKLTSKGYLEGFYYKPRIDKQLLEECNEGIICLSGCAAGELSQLMLQDRHDEAERLVEWYSRVFGDRFYMEIQNAGIPIQKECMDMTVDLANRKGLPLVATNDAHYLNREDSDAQDVLLCISTLSLRSDENRMKMKTDQLFVRTPEEMYEAFPGFEDAVARSQEIADRCDIQLDKDPKHYPVFQPPGGKTDSEYLRELCEAAIPERYPDGTPDGFRQRLDYELDVIERMGYSSYFLIVWDFVRFAMDHDIPCGARGSAAGAVVTYLLRLSNVCPLKYDLLFERFLDPNRAEPPDIDIDFCRDGRQAVIDYTKEKYGEDSVCQIGTFGTLKAKAAVRDVARAFGFPAPRINEIAKMIPDELGIKVKDAVKKSVELSDLVNSDDQVAEVIEIASRLEGMIRNVGTHAAGVVVGNGPLIERLPLQRISGKEDLVSQWDGPHVEKAGLLKMDFLGLRNLTILHKSVQNVQKSTGKTIDPLAFPLDDPETFALLQRGETKGIFQFESGGIRDLLTKMRPDQFADIIATSALYRPGPLEGGMVMDYVDVKNGRKDPAKIHPVVDEVLEETYGVMVYQEQVMRILNRVGGLPLRQAYQCIKAISKKKLETIAKYKEEYLDGARERDIDVSIADNLFNLIEKFAGYGFNKSHSTAYGLVSYQTAYLKAHYPSEFMAALLSCGMESSDRIQEHTDDARRQGIEIIPPDVNRSFADFQVDLSPPVEQTSKGKRDRKAAAAEASNESVSSKPALKPVLFGMSAIKGLGEEACQAIVEAREAGGPFRDIFDLAERVDSRWMTKAVLEVLIKAGALDSFGPNRAQHAAVIERAIGSAVQKAKDKARGQKSLFGDEPEDADDEAGGESSLPDVEDWPQAQRLAAEKEVFGFYLTSHPLTQVAVRLDRLVAHRNNELAELEDGDEVLIGGMISSIKKAATKKPSRNGHTRYANFDFEDATGIVRCIIWPEDYARNEEKVVQEAICVISGRVDRRGREPNVIVNQLMTLEEAEKKSTRHLTIKFQRGFHSTEDVERTRTVLARFPGQTPVFFLVDSIDQEDPTTRVRYTLKPPQDLKITCSAELTDELTSVLGRENFMFQADVKRKNGSGAGSLGR
ncbi:DNA polymerase III subunit alpha [bacterium]|nr:DNA polymerase III subunit alpha [bacterium]